MKNECFWDDKNYQPGKPLQSTESAEFLIVGAGVAGLFTAYFLLKYGVKDIVIIERGEVGSGSTGHSAGMLVSDLETGPWSKVYGEEGKAHALLYFKAQQQALKEVAKIVKQAHIECDFAWRDFLMVSMSGEGIPRLITEFGAQRLLGNNKAVVLEGEELHEELNTSLYPIGERVDQGISVNPIQFVRGAAAYLKERGVKIFEQTPLLEVEEKVAITPQGRIVFDAIVYAQGTSEKHLTLRNVATTIAVTKPLPREVLKGLSLLDKDMFVDMEKPSYHYAKVTGDDRLLVGYGDDEVETQGALTNLNSAHLVQIEQFLAEFAGPLAEVDYAWTGVFSLSKNVLPYVDVTEKKTIIAGMGTQTACIVAAEHAAAMMVKGEHHLKPLFDQSKP